MPRLDPRDVMPSVSIGPEDRLSIGDLVVGLLVLAFFLLTLLAVLQRLAVL